MVPVLMNLVWRSQKTPGAPQSRNAVPQPAHYFYFIHRSEIHNNFIFLIKHSNTILKIRWMDSNISWKLQRIQVMLFNFYFKFYLIHQHNSYNSLSSKYEWKCYMLIGPNRSQHLGRSFNLYNGIYYVHVFVITFRWLLPREGPDIVPPHRYNF